MNALADPLLTGTRYAEQVTSVGLDSLHAARRRAVQLASRSVRLVTDTLPVLDMSSSGRRPTARMSDAAYEAVAGLAIVDVDATRC